MRFKYGLLYASLLAAFSVLALSLSPQAKGELGESGGAAAPPAAVELPQERTATSNTYSLLNGSLKTEIFASPVNYETDDGGWEPIEEGLEEASNGEISNGANSFDLQLPQEMGTEAVRLTEEGSWISYRLLGPATESAEVEDSTASYPSSDGDLEFELQSLSDGVKENIVLEDSSQPSEYRFELLMASGLEPELAEDGSVVVRNGAGDVFAILPAPVVSEGSEELSAPLGTAHFALAETTAGRWLLKVTVSNDWLSDAARQFPVTIDPSIHLFSSSVDCWLGSVPAPLGMHGCGTTGQAELFAAYNQAESKPSRTFLKFPIGPSSKVSRLTSDSYIQKAVLGLYSGAAAENTTALETRRVMKDWTSALNWESPTGNSKNPWTTPGGDFNTEGLAQVQTSKRGSQAGWWNFESESLRSLVAGWAAGSVTNQGLLVKQDNETRTAECQQNGVCPRRLVTFRSSASLPAETRPKLTLTYFNSAPSTSKVTLPSEGTTTARRLKLKAAWSQAGVTGVTFLYREGNKGPFEVIPANLVRDATNQPVSSWPLAVSGVKETKTLYFDAAHVTSTLRKKGGTIQVRALFNTLGTTDGVSAPVEATVDREVGGAMDETAEVGPGMLNLLTGNFSFSRRDVSIPAYNMPLTFSRAFNSRGVNISKVEPIKGKGSPYDQEMKRILGPGWEPSGTMATGRSPWMSIRMVEQIETVEEEEETETGEVVVNTYSYLHKYALLREINGVEHSFDWRETFQNPDCEPRIEQCGEPTEKGFVTPGELVGYGLSKNSSGQFVLATPGGEKTTFASSANGEYVPVSVSQSGGTGQARLIYDIVNGQSRLNTIVAPTPPGINCEEAPLTTLGCKAVKFTYTPFPFGDRLTAINYYANKESWEVAKFAYNTDGFLSGAWDPRISPELKETYTYNSTGQLKTITPPGQQPWTLEYGFADEEEGSGRLAAIKRPTLLSSPTIAQTTIRYGVPVSSTPYDLSASAIAKWGQQDIPVDATAIFPPTEIPSNPASSYAKATIYYMDADGMGVNTATPAGAGTTSASISTTETDEFGNAVRELTPQNRLRALEAPESAQRAAELDTHRVFSADGFEMLEEWGPVHQTALEGGGTPQARAHRVVVYDQASPGGWDAKTPKPGLPTTEVTGASIVGQGVDEDQRITKSAYNWNLRRPIEVVIDPKSESNPEGLNIATRTYYDPATGLVVERRQPSDPEGKTAGTMKTVYYTALTGTAPGCESKTFAGLPCKVMPAAQPAGSGLPELPTKQFAAYNQFSEPLVIKETIGPSAEKESPTTLRTKKFTYDAAGRLTSRKIEGGGTAIPKVETLYSSTLGFPTTEQFVCEEAECTDTQATTSAYDSLGRQTSYEDADGNKATATYDLLGRPVTVTDGKGSQTYKYDATTGLLTALEDSAAGIFTAAYDADGSLVRRGLPNGLTAETSFDPTGAPVHLTYTKSSSCGVSCTWLDFGLERSINGQILGESGTLGTHRYGYDNASRLISAQETPAGGSCTTRIYQYDLDSNRTGLTTRPGLGSTCSGSGGTTQSYKYDAADRLEASGLVYDQLGRITTLPAALAGGQMLTTSYFSNGMVASQSQNGVTNTFQLDASLRQRQRLQAGGLEGTEVFHYAGATDGPAWTQRGTTWTRNIIGIDGELAALQESGSEVTLQLTDLHGDVIATAALNPAVTSLKGTARYDEFGNRTSGTAARFGWLGGALRRTELASGVLQMGARSYVPQLGRFLSPDPIRGGSANAYDYGNADPVNQLDPSGLKPYDSACDSGAVGCQVKLEIWMWSPKGGRMGVRMRWRTNRAFGGISVTSLDITYWVDERLDVYQEGFVKMPPPHYLNSYPGLPATCRGTDPCAENHDGRGTFACNPGDEYQIQLILKYRYNQGAQVNEAQVLEVKAQQGCKYPY